MKIVVTEDIHKEALCLLGNHNIVLAKDSAAIERCIPNADALIVRTYTDVNSKLLSQAKKLKYVIRCGVGLENIDTECCKAHGITVINAPASNADAVAEHTIMLMLAALKDIINRDKSVRHNRWEREPTQSLAGKTVGILGFGNIGKRVAERLQNFGVRMLAYDVIKDMETADKLSVTFVPLETLLKDSDIVTIHIPLLKETHHLIDKKHISMMKKGAILINTSRGAIVDETALAQALKSMRLSFAGIDVFEHEPPGKALLLGLGNTILTPHIAGLTSESFRQMCVQPIKAFLEAIR